MRQVSMALVDLKKVESVKPSSYENRAAQNTRERNLV